MEYIISKKKIVVGTLASILSFFLIATTAYAYFTDTTKAQGEAKLILGYSTELTEDVGANYKAVTMRNTGQSDVAVRIQVFIPTIPGLTIRASEETLASWYCEDSNAFPQTWVYGDSQGVTLLKPQAETKPFTLNIALENETLSQFDITVVGQTSPISYNADNVPEGYLWSAQ